MSSSASAVECAASAGCDIRIVGYTAIWWHHHVLWMHDDYEVILLCRILLGVFFPVVDADSIIWFLPIMFSTDWLPINSLCTVAVPLGNLDVAVFGFLLDKDTQLVAVHPLCPKIVRPWFCVKPCL